MQVKAYLLTWTTYGSWLPGDERGWVDRHNASYGMEYHKPSPPVRRAAMQRMKSSPLTLTQQARDIVRAAIEEVCRCRDWQLVAMNCRSNHVHVLVRTDGTPAHCVMNQFKAYASRSLRRNKLVEQDRIWTRGGSTRHINTEASLLSAEQYVKFQ